MATKLYDAVVNQGRSEAFISYIKRLGDARSRQEEDVIVQDDLLRLRTTLAQPISDPRRLQECVVRLFYAEMLGYGAEFGYIHCINLCSSPLLRCKRTGYLATWLCVSPEHELMYLTVANMQKDLKSDNYLVVAAALTAAATLLRPELMGVVQKEVTALLTHSQPLVRRKAVEALHAFAVKADRGETEPACVLRALGDTDPAVVDAALRLLYYVLPAQRAAYRHLLDPLLSLLRQVIERRLPSGYNFHGVPAPWMQAHLLRLLGLLVNEDTALAQRCEDTLVAVMRRADCGVRVGFAIMYEVIRTVTSAMPGLPRVLQMANEAVAAFLAATSKPNLRYAGVQALSLLVRANRASATLHQRRMIDCLADPDPTIRGKAIAILFAICDADNVELISHRLMRFLTRTSDVGLKRSIACRLCDVVLRDAPSATWYVATMNNLLRIAPDYVPQAAVQRLLKTIAEGDGGYDGDDEEYASENAGVFRAHCVQLYFDLTSQRVNESDREGTMGRVPEVLLRVATWVVGEYGYVSTIGAQTLLDRLCDLLERSHDAVTQEWLLTAMMKIAAQGKNVNLDGPLRGLVEAFARQHRGPSGGDKAGVDLWQRCYEFVQLLQRPELMRRVLPCDGCCADFALDSRLSFLDDVVQEALRGGARRYADEARRRAIVAPSTTPSGEVLRTEAYAPAPRVSSTMLYSVPYTADASSLPTVSAAAPAADGQTREEQPHGDDGDAAAAVKLVVRPQTRRWGRQTATAAARDASASTSIAVALPQPSSVAPAASMVAPSMEGGGAIAAHTDPAVGLSTRHTKFMQGLLAGMQSRARPGCRRVWAGRVGGGGHDGEHRRSVGAAVTTGVADVCDPLVQSRMDAVQGETASPTVAEDTLNALFAAQLPAHDGEGSSSSTGKGHASRNESESRVGQSVVNSVQPLLDARKEHNETMTRLVFRIASQSAAAGQDTMTHVALRLRCPAGCTLVHLSCNAPAALVRDLTVYLPPRTISTPTTSSHCEVSAVLQLVAPFPQMDVVGDVVQAELVACDGEEMRASPFARASLTIELSDLLRPACTLTTPHFAALWPRLAAGEARGGWALRTASAAVLRAVLQAAETAGLSIVEVIGQECIAAATLVGASLAEDQTTSDTSTLLCHLAIVPSSTLQVTVRSAHVVLSAALVRTLETLLS